MHRGMFRRPVGMLRTPLERAMAPREGSERGMFAAGPMVVATPLTALPARGLAPKLTHFGQGQIDQRAPGADGHLTR